MSGTPLVHLVRHGEVENPDHVVYADLPGFGLSRRGREQAAAAAERLEHRRVVAVISSPLQRAMETAGFIAGLHGLDIVQEPCLIEWALGSRWAGIVWEDLPSRRPGELEAYLERPDDLPFAPESIQDVAERVAAVAAKQAADHPDGDVVLVSHQDPVQAGRLLLTGHGLWRLHEDKPGHASVVGLRPAAGYGDWEVVAMWGPPSDPFPPVGAPVRAQPADDI